MIIRALALFITLAAPLSAATWTATPATLAAVAAGAAGGDTIAVTGDGGQLVLPRKTWSPPIVLDLTKATWRSVYLVQANGVTLNDCVIASPPLASSNGQAVRLVSSSDLTFDRCRLTGQAATNGAAIDATVADPSGNVIGLPSGKAFDLGTGSRITVRRSEISGFAKGIILGGGDDVTIEANDIHDLRSTPISGTPGQNNRIVGNRTRDSRPWQFGIFDHGDYLHLWTFKAGPAPAGLVIAGNDFAQGSGFPMLGIYLDDNGYGVGFPGVRIAFNRVTGANGQGIRLERASGWLAWNTMVWTGAGRELNDAPRILITAGSRDLKLVGNAAQGFKRPLIDRYLLTPAEAASVVELP